MYETVIVDTADIAYDYCTKYILDNANIETNLPNIVKPEHFKYLEDARLIYYGMLRNY